MSGRGKPLSIKTDGYGRVKVIAPRPREGPACEKCRNLIIEPDLAVPSSKWVKCAKGRDLEPIGCADLEDASSDRLSTYIYDYDGRLKR